MMLAGKLESPSSANEFRLDRWLRFRLQDQAALQLPVDDVSPAHSALPHNQQFDARPKKPPADRLLRSPNRIFRAIGIGPRRA